LRRCREAAGLSIYALAERSSISERQIRTIESDTPPATVFPSTLRDLALALKCEKADLAFWVEKKPFTGETPRNDPDASEYVPPRTLDEMAAAEREARLAGESMAPPIEGPYGTFELLGAERAVQIRTQYGAFEEQRFVITGTVDNHAALPRQAEAVLQIDGGVGGAFLIGRLIFYDVVLGITVLTTTAELTRYLLDMQRVRGWLHLVVRVVVARPHGDWAGFVGLTSELDAGPLPYAFVVEAAFEPPPDTKELSS
jgi:transcriptional regulator with XRE-family HTH domain